MSSGQPSNEARTHLPDKAAGRDANTQAGDRTGSAARSGLRILILEDEPADAELEQRLLKDAGLDFTAVVVDTEAAFTRQLSDFRPDVILSDFSLPGFSGENALKITREQYPHVPFIFLSGVIGDDTAVELIRQGATDYVLKDRPARLALVIRRAAAEAEQRSQLARLEAHLQRSQRLESIGRLAAGVAHEFNNQIGAMLSYAAFIRDEATGKTQQGTRDESWDSIRRDTEQIEHAGQRVNRLVHQLLAVGGQQMIRADLIDLNQAVGGIDELLRSTAGESIEFHLSLAPQLWPVTADPDQVVQILLNLTLNATEAMPHGGSFWVETQNVTLGRSEAADLGLAPGAYVRLTARDSGAGMEPEVLKHVFEPFFTTKPFVEGAGLGLATVYGIISQAGGTVAISSAPGTGTTVTTWLPAATSATATPPDQPAGADPMPDDA